MQEEFNKTIEKLKIINNFFIDLQKNINLKLSKNFDDYYNSEEYYLDYYNLSILGDDVKTLFNKISSIIYFSKILKNELTIDKIQDINGLANFITSYVPFSTFHELMEDGKIEVIDDKKEERYKEFRKNFKKLVDET